ncbi:MAG: hypothetical protein J0H49_15005 [Acidobacteria bacterium]|nr:hypothetical protein [Acidobacteriota bacterium]
MKTSLALLVVLTGFAAQAQPDPLQGLLEHIQAIAVSEPPVLGIDTQIRTAKAIAGKRPETAKEWLRAASSRSLSLADLHTRGDFLTAIAELFVVLDAAEAEQICALLPLRAAGEKEDPLARCYHKLFSPQRSWEEEKALVRRALSAGAFRAPAIQDHLDRALKQHAEEIAAEFSQVLEGFPSSDASLEERRYLQSMARQVEKQVPGLAVRAMKLAAESPRNAPKEAKDDTGKKKEDDFEPPAGLASSELVSIARNQRPVIHAAMLIDLIDKDKEMGLPQRMALAYEALEQTPKIEAGDERLVCQSMLTRRLYEFGDRAKAAVAAQMLAESFEKIYDCETAACVSYRSETSPGEAINDFAEYLRENKIRPEELGLRHKSLEARLLILDLYTSLGIKRSLFSIF